MKNTISFKLQTFNYIFYHYNYFWIYIIQEADDKKRLSDGSVLEKFKEIVDAQGGDVAFIDDPGKYPKVNYSLKLSAKSLAISTMLIHGNLLT